MEVEGDNFSQKEKRKNWFWTILLLKLLLQKPLLMLQMHYNKQESFSIYFILINIIK